MNHQSHPTSIDHQQDSRSRVASPAESTPLDHATNMTVVPTASQSLVISRTIVATDTASPEALSDTQAAAAVGLDRRKFLIPSTATPVPIPINPAVGVPIFLPVPTLRHRVRQPMWASLHLISVPTHPKGPCYDSSRKKPAADLDPDLR